MATNTKEALRMRHILIVNNQSMFGQGMEHLLREEPGLEVHGCKGDRNSALEVIDQLQPDILVLDCTDMACESAMELVKLSTHRSKLKIILLSLDQTCACIIQREVRSTVDLDLLLDVIRSD
jgi:DNA-binding NarL/FixJ family response regulator